MSASLSKNQVLSTKRDVHCLVFQTGGALADPDADLISLGAVFVMGSTAPDLALATGTMTNVRRPLVVGDFTITATDTGADETSKVAHGLLTGDGPFRPTTTLGGFTAGVDYYPIYVDDNTLQWATSLSNAYAGTALDITADVTGMIFQDVPGSTERAMPGEFVYRAPQAELNFDGSEFVVVVDHPDYDRRNNGGAFSTASMVPATEGFEAIGEGSHTYGDLMRLVVAIVAGAVVDFETGTQAFRNLANTVTRLTGTTTANGRTAITVGTLTP